MSTRESTYSDRGEYLEHACEKYRGRVGRSKEAKDFDEKSITLAVIAHIRPRSQYCVVFA
jgi:hypothetical protein